MSAARLLPELREVLGDLCCDLGDLMRHGHKEGDREQARAAHAQAREALARLGEALGEEGSG